MDLNSSVGIVTRLRVGRPRNLVRFPAGAVDISQVTHLIGNGGYFPGLKRPGLTLITHLHVLPRSRIRKAVSLLRHTFVLVINQLDVQNLLYNKFISCLYMFRAPCAHRQGVKIVLYSLWYDHTYRWASRAQVERELLETCRGMK